MENFIQERNALIKEKDKLYDKIVDYLQELPDTKTKFTLASLKSKIAFFKEKEAKILAGTSFLLPSSVLKINGSIFVWLSSAKMVDTPQIINMLPKINPN